MNCTSPSDCDCDTLCVFSVVSTFLFVSTACYLMCFCCLESKTLRSRTRCVIFK